MEKPAFLFDGRNIVDPDAMRKIGFDTFVQLPFVFVHMWLLTVFVAAVFVYAVTASAKQTPTHIESLACQCSNT